MDNPFRKPLAIGHFLCTPDQGARRVEFVFRPALAHARKALFGFQRGSGRCIFLCTPVATILLLMAVYHGNGLWRAAPIDHKAQRRHLSGFSAVMRQKCRARAPRDQQRRAALSFPWSSAARPRPLRRFRKRITASI